MPEPVPETRSYVHSKCGEVTVVGEGDFKNLASPVPGMFGTVCSVCGRAFPIAEFKWEDSDEEIVSYYKRHSAKVPALIRLLCSRRISTAILVIGFLAGIAVGAWSWNALGALWGIVIGAVASLVGAMASLVIWDGVTNRILSRSLGVPDVRCLK